MPSGCRPLFVESGHAAVWRNYPFSIILKKTVASDEIVSESYTLSWDPGLQNSGVAIVSESDEIVYAAEVKHRGGKQKGGISWALTQRAGYRRGRRTRNLPAPRTALENRKRKVLVLTENGWEYRRAAAPGRNG